MPDARCPAANTDARVAFMHCPQTAGGLVFAVLVLVGVCREQGQSLIKGTQARPSADTYHHPGGLLPSIHGLQTSLVTCGTFLTGIIQEAMAGQAQGWCQRGIDLPEAIHSGCRDVGAAQEQALVGRLAEVWPAKCRGFATRQGIVLFDALNINSADTLTIVSLRHPVDRLASLYSSLRALNTSDVQPFLPKQEDDFSGLLGFAQHLVDMKATFHQTMAGVVPNCSLIDAGDRRYSWSQAETLAVAKKNLQRFCLIVLQERLPESLARLEYLTGWKPTATWSKPVNMADHPVLPFGVRQSLAKILWADMEWYRFAVALFDSDFAEVLM